ncbi:hypothetical protein DSM112329_01753 [Paraconexibacter sp. AEG42_29]|uniref:PASTA domain-containing protein n=1 Tax=Paraconexibacter sp. AEG42_29 TaxID=2997339 RepID=A0AAU7ATD5_9ACTN
MHSRGRRIAALTTVVAVALGGAVAVTAAAAPKSKVPKVRTRIAKLQLNVAGYVEMRQLKDTASDCFPGERWIQTNTFSFETGRFVNVSVKNVSVPGYGSVATSTFSPTVGRAKVDSGITAYKATNYCKGTPAKLDGPPTCSSSSGKIAVALTPGEIPEGAGEDDPAPLAGRPLLLSVRRAGGGRDALGCLGGGPESLSGPNADLSIVTTSIAPGVSEVLPANLDAVKVFAIRARQTMKRAIVISGPCTKTTVKVVPPPGAAPNSGNLNADGDCWMTGKVIVTVRPRPAT